MTDTVKPTPQVAVIILNWNGRKLLEEYLPQVIENTNPEIAEVIVADNGSTDDSLAWLDRNYPQVRRMEFNENLGFAGGYNKAIGLTDAPYTVPVSYTHLRAHETGT